VSNGLERVREAARRDRRARFTALLHHLTPALLRESFQELKKEAAPGIDGVTWRRYEADLNERLDDLHERLHRGAYRALPSRRTYIPKADGRERPLGICSLEDKIVQKAIVKVLNSIYEVDFLGFSYGFRPQRSPHDGLDALSVGITDRKVNWVLDADLRGFFDTIDHGWMMKFVEHRIGDRRVLRLIAKWLKAGILEGGVWSQTAEGTPQGAVISPLLGNVYLHYVFDLWVDHWRKVNARGDVIVVRYADDFVLGFEHRREAERFLHDLRERLGRFGLALHPDKTRLIEFGRFAGPNRHERGQDKPETFDFLGFTHLCGRTRKGGFTVRRKPIARRLRAKLAEIKAALMRWRHAPFAALGRWLAGVLRGYFNYFAVPGTRRCLDAFRTEVIRYWLRALRRRSQRSRVRWATFGPRARQWLPRPRIVHPYPSTRFYATYPRQEPYAVAPHVRICAGGAG
jgi:group II intron reverse transcriptase/maturase